MAQIAKLTGVNIPEATANHPVPHGLVRTPGIVVLLHGTGADITKGNDPDETNIYLTNGDAENPENAEVLVMAVHSVANGDNQMTLLEGTVPEGGGETAVPHGLVRTPSIVLFAFGSSEDVALGATPTDETNIYLTNVGLGIRPYSILVLAPHSIIS